MNIVRGPFNLHWGDDELRDIEEIGFEYDQETEDYQTVQGRTIELDGNKKIAVELTFLEADIESLGIILPQHLVAMGEVLSTGETVLSDVGAIDVVPRSCDQSEIIRDLLIVSCNNPSQVIRINDAKSKLSGVEIDDKIMKVVVRLVGEAPAGEGLLQLYLEGGISDIS